MSRRIVVGHSGGVTSAWCLGWALARYPREQVVALWHDTKMEDLDTVRFLFEIANKLGIEVTERSDGRSVEEVEDDEGALANNRMAFCSRILKAEQRDRYFDELRATGTTEIVNVLGFSAIEWQRIQRATMRAEAAGYAARFPVAEMWPLQRHDDKGSLINTGKQACADWCMRLGVRPPRMYAWSEHANCVGCRRGGKAYWLAVRTNRPDVFVHNMAREKSYGHTFLKDTNLEQLAITGLKRPVRQREAIEINCECGA